MKRQVHEAEVRAKIIKAARLLFLEQGYNQTTIRQIKAASDVKTGTLYHFYSDKEDIFSNIVKEAFLRTTTRTGKLVQAKEKILHLACEMAWHIHVMANHLPSAEMYLISYNSPRIAADLINEQINRSLEAFKETASHLSFEDHNARAMMTKGFLQSVAQKAVVGELKNAHLLIEYGVSLSFDLFGIPKKEIENLLGRLKKLDIESLVRNALMTQSN